MGDRASAGGAVRVTVKTEGFKELQNLYKQLPDKVANRVLAAGVIAGARVIAKQAKQDAPRGDRQNPSKQSAQYGSLQKNIKAKGLRKKYQMTRAAVITRGRAFWGDFLNRGTRYIAANRWYDSSLQQSGQEALNVMRRYMVAKVTQEANRLINRMSK